MEGFQIFELLTFLFCGVRLNNADIIVNKREEVPFSSKAHTRYWAHKVSVNILIRLYSLLLRCLIISLYDFCLFVAIAHTTFSIINRDNIMIGKISS